MGLRIVLFPCRAVYHFFKYLAQGLAVFPKALVSLLRHALYTITLFLGFFHSKPKLTTNPKSIKTKKKKKENKDFGTKLNDFGENVIASSKNAGNYIEKKADKIPLVKKAKENKKKMREEFKVNFDEDGEKSKTKQVYEYVVEDKEGKTIKGYFEAFSKVEVNSYLVNEGYKVFSIRTSKAIQFFHGPNMSFHGRFKTKDLIFMLAQLSTYLKAGIPLADSVKILTRQFQKNKNYKKILDGVFYDLSVGKSFSEALEKQGDAFPRLLINMIKTAEMTGELPETLDDMEEYYTESEATRKAMVSAMMYPVIIFIVAIAVGLFIMLYVVPRFVEIYESMDQAQIPGITLFVLWLSDFLSNYAILIGIVVIVILIIIIYLYRNVKSVRSSLQWFAMHIPAVGNVIIYNEVTMFTKTFASLLAHNVFITDTMDILSKVSNNEIYKQMINNAITNISKGGKVSEAFKDQWAFPIPAYEMIVTGEKTGQLPEMMEKVAAYYQDLHKNAVSRIKTFIEPVMIILLTVMVGVIVLSIVVPMFNMYSTIRNR